MDKPPSHPLPETGPIASGDLTTLAALLERARSVEFKFFPDAPSGVGGAAGTDAQGAPSVESRLAALEREIATLRVSMQEAVAALSAAAEAPPPLPAVDYPAQTWARAFTGILIAVAMLMLAHWIIVIVYDAPTLVLRLASVALPIPVALWMTLLRRISPPREIAIALAIGLLAVLGMSVVTAAVEKTSVLPENLREWREVLEYVASIAFAYLTGVLIASARQTQLGGRSRLGQSTLRLAQVLAHATGKAIASGPQLKKQVNSIQDLINGLMPIVTAIISIVTGIISILH